MTLKASAAHDPFGGGPCPGEVGYRELPSSPARERSAAAKLNPAWTGGSTPLLHWFNVTCDGLDFISLALLPSGDLAYVAEGELTYRLAKGSVPKR